MVYGAYGLVEVLGDINSVVVVDQMLKTAAVNFETIDTKCGGHVLIFVSGEVSAVTSAVDSVTTNPPCKIFNSAVVSNPSEEMINIVEMFKARRAKK